MLDRERDGNRRRCLERQVETRDHAACDVDGERQPRPLERLSILTIDDDDISQRMVDLDNAENALGLVLPGNRPEAVTGCFRAMPRPGKFGWLQGSNARLHGVPGRRPHATHAAKPANLLEQLVDARLLTRLVEIPYRLGNHGFGLVRKPPTAASRSCRLRQQ